jgi:phosphoribosylformimino-5-aminoimidazole carboxamide ribotide isomerase
MELIPAVDLAAGRIVRLVQGDFGRSTDYGANPVAIALGWAAAGAKRVHLVDLDGARAGRPVQSSLLQEIVSAVTRHGTTAQVAGGLRSGSSVAAALATGAERAVLGTALLRDPSLGASLVGIHGRERIVAALDVREGAAVGEAWREGAAGRPVLDALWTLRAVGIGIFAVTAIAGDGLLEGPDLELLGIIRAAAPDVQLIASGGVGSLDDLRRIRDLGADAAIVGRALYEGRIDVREAIAEMAETAR